MFDLLDFDNDNELNIDEFVSGCLHMRGPARSLDLERCNFCLRQIRSEVIELKRSLYEVGNLTKFERLNSSFETVNGMSTGSGDASPQKAPVFVEPGSPP